MSGFVSTPLTAEHHTNFLNCGETRLDDWLYKHALDDQGLGKSRTHVWIDDGGMVVGYFTLLPTTIRETPNEPGLLKRLKPARYQGDEVPGVLIGKVAIDQSLQGQGRGIDLLAEAWVTAYEAVLLIGGVYLVIEPMAGRAKLRTLYEGFGFETIEGTDRMFLSFNEFSKGSPI